MHVKVVAERGGLVMAAEQEVKHGNKHSNANGIPTTIRSRD